MEPIVYCKICRFATKSIIGDMVVYTCDNEPRTPYFYCAAGKIGEPKKGLISHTFGFDEEQIRDYNKLKEMN